MTSAASLLHNRSLSDLRQDLFGLTQELTFPARNSAGPFNSSSHGARWRCSGSAGMETCLAEAPAVDGPNPASGSEPGERLPRRGRLGQRRIVSASRKAKPPQQELSWTTSADGREASGEPAGPSLSQTLAVTSHQGGRITLSML
jgi:hypothetical protein